MGNGKGVFTALNALRVQVFLPLVWRILEYIALWAAIFDYKAGDYLIEKFSEVNSFRDHANWFGGRNWLDIASLMYLVIIINSIHLFVLFCSFFYFFYI